MWDFADAQKKIVEVAGEGFFQATEQVSVGQASGRFLAEQVVSPVALPPFDYSAMDGYAVRTSDFRTEGEIALPVVGECRTGHAIVPVPSGSCVRIFTGALIPEGADAVVMQENVTRVGDRASFHRAPRPGDHIRRAGEDVDEGAVVLEAGTRLHPMHLGLLASVERSEVRVSARPHCTILCTGDELRAPGQPGPVGSLAESNSPALIAFIQAVGGTAVRAPIVPDRLEAMKEALVSARDESNVIITVGGVSVGDHDLVAPALQQLGAEIFFHKVRIKPGKPILFARLGGALVLGLPGNPSSAQVTFALFGAPLLRALQGCRSAIPNERSATLSHDFSQKPGRRGFYRARVEGDSVSLLANQSSGASTAMAWGNALAIVTEDQTELPAGTRVPTLGYGDLWG